METTAAGLQLVSELALESITGKQRYPPHVLSNWDVARISVAVFKSCFEPKLSETRTDTYNNALVMLPRFQLFFLDIDVRVKLSFGNKAIILRNNEAVGDSDICIKESIAAGNPVTDQAVDSCVIDTKCEIRRCEIFRVYLVPEMTGNFVRRISQLIDYK